MKLISPGISSKRLTCNADEMELIRKENSKILFPEVRFNFIREHNGLRPGKKHVVISTTGTGKSTIARTIVKDCAKTHPVLVYSSEEDRSDCIHLFDKSETPKEITDNIHLLEEVNVLDKIKTSDYDSFFSIIAKNIIETGSKAFFFDNITTSDFYDCKSPAEQVRFSNKLSAMVKLLNVPAIIVAHSQSQIKDDQQTLIGAEDIRGSKSISNKAEYFYVYQRLKIHHDGNEIFYPIIRVVKSRLGNNTHDIYRLHFSYSKKEYYEDKKISFKEFKEAYEARIRLTRK